MCQNHTCASSRGFNSRAVLGNPCPWPLRGSEGASERGDNVACSCLSWYIIPKLLVQLNIQARDLQKWLAAQCLNTGPSFPPWIRGACSGAAEYAVFPPEDGSYTTGRLCSTSPDEAHAALGSPNTAGFGTCRFLAEGKGDDEQNSHPSVPPALLMCIRVTLQNPEVQGTNISSPREGLCAAWAVHHNLAPPNFPSPASPAAQGAPLLGIEPRVAAKQSLQPC